MEDIEVIKSKLLEILEKGLVKGLGVAEPGKFCAEAAVCYALGEPHSDSPTCVHRVDRTVAIRINDCYPGTEKERADVLRPILLSQLGTAGRDRRAWLNAVIRGTIQTILPLALNSAANILSDETHRAKLREAAEQCAELGTKESAAHAARRAAAAAYAAAADAAYAAAAAAARAADAADSVTYAAAAAAAATEATANAAANAATDATASTASTASFRKEVWNRFAEVVKTAYELENNQ